MHLLQISHLVVSKQVSVFLLVAIAGIMSCHNADKKNNESIFQKTIARNAPATDWMEYNGDGARSHYSMLGEVTKENIANLKVAWTYSSVGVDSVLNGTQMQCNPIIIEGILYGVSAKTQVFALDAATGKELWKTAFVAVDHKIGNSCFFGCG